MHFLMEWYQESNNKKNPLRSLLEFEKMFFLYGKSSELLKLTQGSYANLSSNHGITSPYISCKYCGQGSRLNIQELKRSASLF